MKKKILKQIIIYLSVCIIVLNTFLSSYFNVKATGLEIPVLVGGGLLGTDACISLVVSLGVALGGGHALNTIATEKGYNNAYDYIYNSLDTFCSDSGRTIAEYSQGLTELLSYTKEGYILLGNDAKSYIKAFISSFDETTTIDGTFSYNGYNFAYIPAGTECMSVYENDTYMWRCLDDNIAYLQTDYWGDKQFFLVPVHNWNTPNYTQFIRRNTWNGKEYEQDSFNKYPAYPYNKTWAYHRNTGSYSDSKVYFDFSNLTDFKSFSSSAIDNIVLSLLGSFSAPTTQNIYSDAQPLIDDTTQPLIVNPDVLPNTVGVSAVTPSDYAGILNNYYSNVFETPTYIIDNSSVINNYYASNIPASDNVQPFYPIKDEDNYLSHTPNEDLLKKFPFCIPVDISNFIAVFKAEKQAPIFVYGFDVFGEHYEINIDFSMFDTWSIILRDGLSLIYILSLMLLSRKLIRA